MPAEELLIPVEFRFSIESELQVIEEILSSFGIGQLDYYDGMIEARVPGKLIEVMKQRNVLMDITEKKTTVPRFSDTFSNENFIKPDYGQKDKAAVFSKLAQHAYLDSGHILFREQPAGRPENNITPPDLSLYHIVFSKPFDSSTRIFLKEYRIELYSTPHPTEIYSYISCLNGQQYDLIVSLNIIISIENYRIENKPTKFFFDQWVAEKTLMQFVEMRQLYDITVLNSRYTEMFESLEILDTYGVIIDKGSNTIRVRSSPDSPLFLLLAGIPYVTSIAPYEPALLYCDICRKSVGLQFTSPAVSFLGDSEVVAVIDSGIDTAHKDLQHRIKSAIHYGTGVAQDRAGHGTHVAGIICGDGDSSGGAITGIAPASKIVSIGVVDANNKLVLPADIGVLLQLAVENGAKIINLSWGYKLSGEYQQGSYSVDQFIYDHPEILVVVAAGNEGNAVSGQLAYRTIGVPGSAKNVLTVGAASSRRLQPVIKETWGSRKPASFPSPPMNAELIVSNRFQHSIISSTGPTDYDSIKPEIVAPGTYILSAKASASAVAQTSPEYYNNDYTFKSGTSMATPVVSGIAAVLREFLRLEYAYSNPTSSLLKAIIIGSSYPIENSRKPPDESLREIGFPDFDQGFGMVNMSGLLNTREVKLAFADIRNSDTKALESRVTIGGGVKSYREYIVEVDTPETDLSITLCWIDLPARGVQNNLQLSVKTPDNKWEVGNSNHIYKKSAVFDVLNSFSLKPHDKFNTTEKVFLQNVPAGKYHIRVTAQNTINSKQGYSVAVLGSILNFAERT